MAQVDAGGSAVPSAGSDLAARYLAGPVPDVVTGSPTVSGLLAHRSVRRYTAEDVTDQQVATLVAAAQSASSSSNLQVWSVVEVRDPATKQVLFDVSGGGNEHLLSAPVVLVWVADLARAHQIVEDAGGSTGGADYLETTLVAFSDAMIAAQNAAVAAEALGLGICYVGSLRNDVPRVADVLALPQHSVAVVGMTLGHPDAGRPARIKTRLPVAAVWHKERYDLPLQRAEVARYEQAVGEFYRGQGLPPSWTARIVARLARVQSLHGRERMTEWLRARGLGVR